MNEPIVIKTEIQKFRELLESGVEKIRDACVLYVTEIDKNPDAREVFKSELFEFIPNTAWAEFEKVGRCAMDYRLLFGGGRNAHIVKKLPLSCQVHVLDGNPCDYLTPKGDTLKVDLRDCEPEIAKQCTTTDGFRGLPAQKAYAESKRNYANTPQVDTMPYSIKGGCVTFKKNISLTKNEISLLLRSL